MMAAGEIFHNTHKFFLTCSKKNNVEQGKNEGALPMLYTMTVSRYLIGEMIMIPTKQENI